MKLVKLDGEYFNPEQVVALKTVGDYTYVWVAGGDGSEDGVFFPVYMPIDEVAKALTT